MSFLSFLGKVNHDVQTVTTIAAPFAPYISAISPTFGLIFNAITMVEGLIQTPGEGPAKREIVLSIARAAMPKVDQAKLGTAIDGIVAILNSLQAVAPLPEPVA